jgi:hypothetical protein
MQEQLSRITLKLPMPLEEVAVGHPANEEVVSFFPESQLLSFWICSRNSMASGLYH